MVRIVYVGYSTDHFVVNSYDPLPDPSHIAEIEKELTATLKPGYNVIVIEKTKFTHIDETTVTKYDTDKAGNIFIFCGLDADLKQLEAYANDIGHDK
ncbi:hypothetical protein GGF41_004585, partial [Coemansia sp. RSA 2531]